MSEESATAATEAAPVADLPRSIIGGVHYECPHCASTLFFTRNGSQFVMECKMFGCKELGNQFEVPTVPLIRVKK
jgi:hypothetical protein